ncbi:ATP-binding cassette domain-containing protein [Spirosoma jeollabukense]
MDLFGKPAVPAMKLEADSIWLAYGQRKVLQNIYLRVDVGRIIGLLGRNGCGKSSLLEIIYGIRSAQNASVRVDGNYIKKLFHCKNVAAYLPQKNFVPAHLRVDEAFTFYQSVLMEANELFPELKSLFPFRFNQLSGGQQRLVETLMVATCPASFIILDEPFSNVMPLHVDALKTLFISLKSRKGILITDHYYHEVLAISDSLYLLNTGGRTIQLQQPEQQLKDFGYIN